MSMIVTGYAPKYDDVMHEFAQINRYLFQAYVYLSDRVKKPKIEGDPEKSIERITKIGKTAQLGDSISNKFVGPIDDVSNSYAEYTLIEKFSDSDIKEITNTVQLINQDKWEILDNKKIETSQEILLKFLRIVKNSIK